MTYSKVYIEAIDYELAPVVVATADLEAQLLPLYSELRIAPGQVQAMTGIRERRWWEPGYPLSAGAVAAAKKLLASSNVGTSDIGALMYTGVCREQFEPATACHVANGLGLVGNVVIQDISNACLGVLSGMLDIANRIELGQIRAGLVVSCESAREINEEMIKEMLEKRNMGHFATSLATLTGGSGAVAVLMTDGSFGNRGHRLLGGVTRAEPLHHNLCLWGMQADGKGRYSQSMSTDGVNVMNYGVQLGLNTWQAFLPEVNWQAEQVDRVICHQVGSAHQKMILETLGIAEEKDFTTFEYLGNIGTVSLPITAALAAERDILQSGDNVAFLGIGSGLNCMMLAVEW